MPYHSVLQAQILYNHIEHTFAELKGPNLGSLAEDYIGAFKASNNATAEAYRVRLRLFSQYLDAEKKTSIDAIVKKMQSRKEDPYSIVAGFAAHMGSKNVSARYQTQTVKTIRNFLETNDVELSDHKFKLRVKLKRVIKKKKTPLSKEEVYQIIRACAGDMRLTTYVMFLASTGMRATEALYVKPKDINFEAEPPFVFVHGEHTKTGADRIVYLTAEMVEQLRTYLAWKYRERRTRYTDKKPQYGRYEPELNDDHPVFLPFHHEGAKLPRMDSAYQTLLFHFTRTLKRLKLDEWEDETHRRRKRTFHSFRRFVKTTISNLGYQDYSEWFIGHEGSTYHATPDEEKIKIFRKIEPYLTFTDLPALQARQQDIATQLADKDERMRRLEERLETMSKRLEEDNHNTEVLSSILTAFVNENPETKDNRVKDAAEKVMQTVFANHVRRDIEDEGRKQGMTAEQIEAAYDERMKTIEHVKKQLIEQGIIGKDGPRIRFPEGDKE
jgi:integrase